MKHIPPMRKRLIPDPSDDYLNEILLRAETAPSAPADPKGGIPKQWLPGFVRWPLKLLFLPALLLDLSMQNLAKKIIRPPFKQVGTCKKRGNCCHYILLPEPKGLFGKLFYFWQTQVNGFYVREKSPCNYEGERVLVMGCRYLKKDGSCKHYKTRPIVCRKWPQIEYFGMPRMLKGCGFTPELRKGYQKEPYLSLLQESRHYEPPSS